MKAVDESLNRGYNIKISDRQLFHDIATPWCAKVVRSIFIYCLLEGQEDTPSTLPEYQLLLAYTKIYMKLDISISDRNEVFYDSSACHAPCMLHLQMARHGSSG